jgi:hypothetical protein
MDKYYVVTLIDQCLTQPLVSLMMLGLSQFLSLGPVLCNYRASTEYLLKG